MPAPTKQTEKSNFYDSDTSYGWISIALHWLTATLIIALWIIGKSISSAEPDSIDARRSLHVSIAATAWLVIFLRVLWRLRSGHPHVRGQSDVIHRVAKIAHYASLIAVLAMLVSGPVMVWARGFPVGIFGALSIPGPVGKDPGLAALALGVHSGAAALLLAIVLLHIGGALKHLMFHTDDTIVRMLWPAGNDGDRK
ncbi:MAG: cytochrome b/b6 domain-containing protein [Gammaproteobacteria bacterium]|nr:cytochrome b/b6 domain-containing protein [Gammaproteobacteria bacterium]